MKRFLCIVLAAAIFLLLAAGVSAQGAPEEGAQDPSAGVEDVTTEESEEEVPAWQAIVEDILAYVVLGITAIIGIYTAFSPLLILLKKAANKFTSATSGVISTAETGDKQNAELKNLKAEFEGYIKTAKEVQEQSAKEAVARAERTEEMLLSVMQMFSTMCCASPDLVKSGVARKVADLKNQFSAAVPVLKDARKESADHGEEA